MPTSGMKQKTDIHLSRKLWHLSGIMIMALVYNYASLKVTWTVLLILSIVFIPLDVLRLKSPQLNQATLRLFGHLMRKRESTTVSSMTYLYLGCMFLLALNKHHVVTLTLLFLAIGDPVASYFGIRYGKDPILRNKTLQGTAAAFIACTVVAGVYYYFNNLMTERLLIVVPLSGLIGALAELLPIGQLDDNLTFPVVASSLLWLLFTIYGGF